MGTQDQAKERADSPMIEYFEEILKDGTIRSRINYELDASYSRLNI